MPSAQGPSFCRKQLREKVGVKVRYFIGVSAHGPILYCRQKIGPTERLFIGVSFGAYCPIFDRSWCAVIMTGEVPSLDYVTPIFFIGLKSAPADRVFMADKLSEEKVRFLSDQKSAHTNPFSFRFILTTIKNRSINV